MENKFDHVFRFGNFRKKMKNLTPQGRPVIPVVLGREIIHVESKPDEYLNVTEHITPLMHAVIYNQQKMIRILLENDADVNTTTNSGNTALHYGCLMNHSDAIRLLLQNGANPNVSNSSGQTPLLVCTQKVLTCFVEE